MSDHKLVVVETILNRNSEAPDCISQCDSFTPLNFFSEDTNWTAINNELLDIQWNTVTDNMNSQQIMDLIHLSF